MNQSITYFSYFDLTTNTKLLHVVMSPSPYMWIFFKWTCMLIILDQSKYGRIFIHEKVILQIFSIIVLFI